MPIIRGTDLTPLPYFRDPAKPGIEAEAARLSRWLVPYDDRALYPQEGDYMLRAGLRRAQFAIYRHPARFRVAATGRRTGKTEEVRSEVIRAVQTGFRKEVGVALPTLKDAKRLYWLALKRMIPKDMILWKNETTLEILIRGFESRIRLFGADRPESIYGEGLDFLAIDEAQSVPESYWVQYASPTLVDKQGEALITFRPEGMNWCYDLMVQAADPGSGWQGFEFTTLDGENVPRSEIERERAQKTEWQFKQEYEASFQNPTGQVYKEFSRSLNVDHEALDSGSGGVLVGMDFNVAPFCMVFGRTSPDGRNLLIFDEMELWGAHTQAAIHEIHKRFPGRPCVIYPDPSGRSRHTAAGGLTNFHLLAQGGFRVIAPSRTPKVKDRINTVQAMLHNAKGERRLRIHPRCKRLIRSLEGLSYTENDDVDKKSGFDHMTDALGYLVWSLFPLVKYHIGTARVAG